jgi:ribose 5-phosphate isomerase A
MHEQQLLPSHEHGPGAHLGIVADGRDGVLYSRPLILYLPAMNPKRRAAEAALKYLADGMVVGLGTGSTADEFLQALSAALKSGKLNNIRGVPTSQRSQQRARELGIPLVELSEASRPDVTVDGADEIAPGLDLIKGLGGALLREKVVAQASKKLVIIADSAKTVAKLGTRSALPVEVVKFAHDVQADYLKTLGAEPVLRLASDGGAMVTDNGNYIYDCRFSNGIDQPRELEAAMRSHAGIVETGLFLGIASVALIATAETVDERTR